MMTIEQQRALQRAVSADLKALRLRIGNNIRRLRHERKMTLAELSRCSGLNPVNIDRLEMGGLAVDLDHVVRLAHAFKASCQELTR